MTSEEKPSLLQRAWAWIHQTFPERQIYIRSDGRVQFFTFGPKQSTGADLLNLGGDLPAAANSILPHGLDLKRERLLVMTGDARVEGDARPVGGSFSPWPKTLSGSGF